MKYNVAIIGTGQLGSRHLQGVLTSSLALEVHVMDVFKASLDQAEQRASEVEHSHKLSFHLGLTTLPKELDLVIVATNADVRASVTQELLEYIKVKNLVLEKEKKKKIDDYGLILDLTKKHNTNTWVNHPRRYQSLYKDLKKELASSEISEISVFGQNWGLACNCLHFLDLISFLTNSDIQSLNTVELDDDILESKRAGNLEVTGSVVGKADSGTRYRITSVKSMEDSVRPISILINTANARFFIQEGAKNYLIRNGEFNGFQPEIDTSSMLFQSELSGLMVDDILKNNMCPLPSLEEASKAHVLFIREMLNFFNKNNNINSDICPIT